MSYVILLHFAQPVNPDYPARHYLEYAENIRVRLADHTAGDRTRTSGIMYACYERNISFVVARIWVDATRRNEYQLRQLANNPRLCPICNPALALYTTYQPNDLSSWVTIRLQPDTTTPRYGDLETLKPYKYKPKHRTRSNGESNSTSGNASTWRQDTKAALTVTQPLADQPPAELIQALGVLGSPGLIEVVQNGVYSAPDGTLYTPEMVVHSQRLTFRKIEQPIDTDHAPTGFDADLPY